MNLNSILTYNCPKATLTMICFVYIFGGLVCVINIDISLDLSFKNKDIDLVDFVIDDLACVMIIDIIF